MLTDLFPKAYGRYDGSPVAPWLRKFAEWLTNRGYSRKAIRWHVLRLRQALERAGGFPPPRGLTSRQLDELFVFPTCSAQYRATGHNFQRFLISTGQRCLLSEPEFGRFTDILVAYKQYLLDVRGFVVETTRHHLATAYAFLCQAVKPNRQSRAASPLSSLFLGLRAPAQALTSTSIRSIYRRRARQSGLPLEGTSSYSLRHGFAMHLLEHGVGIKAIGDLLGHRTVESTSVYLRLQIESLREVGLSLPRPAEADGGHNETV